MKFLKKMTKEKSRQLSAAVATAEIALGFGIVLMATSLFFIGYHNSDLGQNVRWMECAFNTRFVDVGLDGTERVPMEMLQIGNKQQIMAFFFGMCGAVLFMGGVMHMETLVMK